MGVLHRRNSESGVSGFPKIMKMFIFLGEELILNDLISPLLILLFLGGDLFKNSLSDGDFNHHFIANIGV